MRVRLIILVMVTVLLYGCSSMGFIPPKYSLATTDYVNAAVGANLQAALSEFKENSDKLIDEINQQIEVMNSEMENQKQSMDEAMASIAQIQDLSNQIRIMTADSKNELKLVKEELLTNLEIITVRADSLTRTLNDLQEKDKIIESKAQEIEQKIRDVHKETLNELSKAIISYYNQ